MDPFEISKMSKENKQRLAGAGLGAAAVGVPMGVRGSGAGVRQVIRGVRQEFKAGRKLAEGAADVAAANATATRIQAAGRAPNPREAFVDIPQALQRARRGNRKASEAEAESRAAWENIRRGGKRVKQGIPREIGGSAAGAAAGAGGVAAYQKVDERKALTKAADPFEISKAGMAGHRVAQIGSYGVRSVPKAAPGARGAVGRRVAEQQQRMASVNQYSTTAVPKAPTQARMNEARAAAKPASNFSWGRLAAYGGGGAAVVGAPVAAYGMSRKSEVTKGGFNPVAGVKLRGQSKPGVGVDLSDMGSPAYRAHINNQRKLAAQRNPRPYDWPKENAKWLKKEGSVTKRDDPFEISKRGNAAKAMRQLQGVTSRSHALDNRALNVLKLRAEAGRMGQRAGQGARAQAPAAEAGRRAKTQSRVAQYADWRGASYPQNISYGNQSALRRGTNNRYTRLPE